MNGDASASRESQFPAEPTAAGWFDLGYRSIDDNRAEHPGAVIGRYRLIALLGEGGFGTVWQVEQTEPIRRELALKLIKRGMDSRDIIARFGAESQALALMDHPNIAAVLDAGTTPDGRPYFAMEWVKGEPLTTYCDSRSLTIRERLELFIPVCQAVQHAHQKAILHRDLKPSNVLVTGVDGKAVPKVIDFGIAKALGASVEDEIRTRAGAVVGTPHYMSPEQAGSVPDVDTRSDIYSLGVILYELLTGQTPLARAGGENIAHDQILHRIRVEEAMKPSNGFHPPTKASREAATCRCADPSRLRRLLRGDLDWIVLKALEKDRRRRYETATALAADLRRFLNQEPVSAAAPTWSYQFSKFARRNRVGFGTAGIVSVALVAGAATSLWQARVARKANAEAQSNYNDARAAVEQYLSRVTGNSRLLESNFATLRKELLETAMPFYQKMGEKAGRDPALVSDRAWAMGRLADIYQQLGNFQKAEEFFREAIFVHQRLLSSSPGNREHREALTLHYNNLTRLLGQQARYKEAIETQRKARDLSEQLVAQWPTDPKLRFGLMTILLNQVFQLNGDDRKAEAEQSLNRALLLGRKLVAEVPFEPDYRGQLASCLSTMGGFHHDARRIEESEGTFREAMVIQEKLVAEFPEQLDHAASLIITCHNLGHLLSQNGRPQDALPVLSRATEIGRRMVAQYPEMPRARVDLAGALGVLGTVFMSLDRDGEALPIFQEAVKIEGQLCDEHPENPQYWYLQGIFQDRLGVLKRKSDSWMDASGFFRQAIDCQRKALRISSGNPLYQSALRIHLRGLAEVSFELKDHRATEEAVVAFSNGPLLSGEDHEAVAVILAKNISRVDQDASLPAEEKSAVFQRCSALAVKALENACALGQLDLYSAIKNERFASLRRYPPFMDMAEPPPDPVDRSPARFTFDYPYEDPGKRIWSREGKQWTEVQPSGKRNVYQIEHRIRLAGVSGTEVVHTVESGLRIFIPDKNMNAPSQLKARPGDNEWLTLGAIGDVE